jgi:RNA polymerase sigma-70 factor (ECF subfamily)
MDESGFEKLYEKTARPLRSYVERITGSATLADDILQETFLRYLRAPLKVEDDAVKSYLYKIATNLVYDHFRQTKRASRWQILLRTQPEAEIVDDNFAGETEMMQVFRHLQPQERALLWLAYVEGYQHREIAATLNLSVMSIKVLLFRARRKLAQMLGD